MRQLFVKGGLYTYPGLIRFGVTIQEDLDVKGRDLSLVMYYGWESIKGNKILFHPDTDATPCVLVLLGDHWPFFSLDNQCITPALLLDGLEKTKQVDSFFPFIFSTKHDLVRLPKEEMNYKAYAKQTGNFSVILKNYKWLDENVGVELFIRTIVDIMPRSLQAHLPGIE